MEKGKSNGKKMEKWRNMMDNLIMVKKMVREDINIAINGSTLDLSQITKSLVRRDLCGIKMDRATREISSRVKNMGLGYIGGLMGRSLRDGM